jgi:hypothetical protein
MLIKMGKLNEACALLKSLGLPKEQTNDLAGLVFLALAYLNENDTWPKATDRMYTTRQIMDFIDSSYGVSYAPNSRETIRRKALHQFEQAQLVVRNHDDPKRATNSPLNNYKLSPIALAIITSYPNGNWRENVEAYLTKLGSLKDMYEKRLDAENIPVQLFDGQLIKLSPGEHNQLHRDIIEKFAPRFIKGSPKLLYIGDTASSRGREGGKHLHVALSDLEKLGIPPMSHGKLPDVVILEEDKNWLFLIEAVTSHGPVSPKRHYELETIMTQSSAGRVYVTAFPDLQRFKKYASDIAWETEVWISEMPDHMIHFNGDRFLGPRETLENPSHPRENFRVSAGAD